MDTGKKIKTRGKDSKGNVRRERKHKTGQQIQTGRENQTRTAVTSVAVADAQ
jgi:hypothetical protein